MTSTLASPTQEHLSTRFEAPLVFLDTETCGLSLDDPIWEVGAIRRDPDGSETQHHWFVEHDVSAAEALPQSFRDDHNARYNPAQALSVPLLAEQLTDLFRPGENGAAAHLVGANPNFDAARIFHQVGVEPWHYHIICVESMMLAALALHRRATIPWASDMQSRGLGLDCDKYKRHTALGDAAWARDVFTHLTGRMGQ